MKKKVKIYLHLIQEYLRIQDSEIWLLRLCRAHQYKLSGFSFLVEEDFSFQI